MGIFNILFINNYNFFLFGLLIIQRLGMEAIVFFLTCLFPFCNLIL